jgi:FSR family fosmidomycin resistance protein-like MFS transporter
MSSQATHAIPRPHTSKTVFPVLWAVSLCHLLNDMTQALLPAVYPILRGALDLSFAQVGFLTFVYQITASLLQPFIGLYTDRRPMPYSLPFGMASSMAGLLTIAFAPSYGMLLVGSMLLGLGSSIFHPESSRIARLASGDRACLVRARHPGGHHHPDGARPLVSAEWPCEASIECCAGPPPHAVAWARVKGDVDPDRAHVLEIHLFGELHELLHLLPDG